MNKQISQWISRVLLCFWTAALLMASVTASAADPQDKLIVLLDVSGSMEANDPDRQAIQWAEELYANCSVLGIDVQVITFSSEPSQLDPTNEQIPIPDQLEELRANGYSGATTDHLSAIELAGQLRGQDTAARTGIVMLSDGALDLIGRGAHVEGALVPTDAARTEEEKEAIDAFMDKCGELGGDGCQLLLVGFGETDGDLEDSYAVSGFGMFQNVGGKNNCTFLRATDVWDEGIIQHLFAMFGFPGSGSTELPVENGSIFFELSQDYYKVNLCINKKDPGRESAPLEKGQFEITWRPGDGESAGGEALDEDAFQLIEYNSFIFLSLDFPKAGTYQIVLPEQLENVYEIARKLSIDLPSLSIALMEEHISQDPLTYEIQREDGTAACELQIDFGDPEMAADAISDCSYTLTPLPPSETQDPMPQSLPIVERAPGKYAATISFPKDIDYFLQIHVVMKDGTEIDSNTIRINVLPSDPIPVIEKRIGQEIPITPSVLCPEIDADIDPSQITYLIDGQEVSVPCETDEYRISGNLETGITLVFKQEKDYAFEMRVHGASRVKLCYRVVELDCHISTEVIVAIVAIVAIAVVAAIVVIVVCRKRRERKERPRIRK